LNISAKLLTTDDRYNKIVYLFYCCFIALVRTPYNKRAAIQQLFLI